MGYGSWDPITQQAILALTSPDPAIPVTTPYPELLEFCREATGTRMAQKCSTKYPRFDFTPDIALMGNIKKGNFVMNETFWQGVKVTGISPLSCPPTIIGGSSCNHTMAMAKIDLYVTHAVANTLTQEDICSLSCQSYYILMHDLQLLSVMENYLLMHKICFSIHFSSIPESSTSSIALRKCVHSFTVYRKVRGKFHVFLGWYGPHCLCNFRQFDSVRPYLCIQGNA